MYKRDMVGRVLAAAIAGILLLPAPGAAQASGRAVSSPTVIRHDPPRPSQAAPPPLEPPPPAAPRDLFRADPNTYAPRYDRPSTPSRRQRRFPGGYGYGYGGYGYAGFGDAYGSSRRSDTYEGARGHVEPTGGLRLQILPGTAEVYIDGLYVGTANDFAFGAGRALESGPHRVEVRANGFETLSFDVRIPDNETVTFRRDLQRPAPSAAVAAARPRTFYVIPRCYAGDTRPRAEQLPTGCRVANLREVPPLVSSATPSR
jgi:hypothetical protein